MYKLTSEYCLLHDALLLRILINLADCYNRSVFSNLVTSNQKTDNSLDFCTPMPTLRSKDGVSLVFPLMSKLVSPHQAHVERDNSRYDVSAEETVGFHFAAACIRSTSYTCAHQAVSSRRLESTESKSCQARAIFIFAVEKDMDLSATGSPI